MACLVVKAEVKDLRPDTNSHHKTIMGLIENWLFVCQPA